MEPRPYDLSVNYAIKIVSKKVLQFMLVSRIIKTEVIKMLHQQVETTVKYTAVLPREYLDELRKMSEKKIISSVNQGIRAAVADFVTAHKRQEYFRAMKEAAGDKAFIERTMGTQQAFAAVDAEDGEW